jgi:hypothetical protein
MTRPRGALSGRQLVIYFIVQLFWVLLYLFSPAGPHIIQGLGIVQQVFVTLFSVGSLYFLAHPSFWATFLSLVIASRLLREGARTLQIAKLKVRVSVFGLWCVAMGIAFSVRVIEQLHLDLQYSIRGLIFGVIALLANYSAYWLAIRFGSREPHNQY